MTAKDFCVQIQEKNINNSLAERLGQLSRSATADTMRQPGPQGWDPWP